MLVNLLLDLRLTTIPLIRLFLFLFAFKIKAGGRDDGWDDAAEKHHYLRPGARRSRWASPHFGHFVPLQILFSLTVPKQQQQRKKHRQFHY